MIKDNIIFSTISLAFDLAEGKDRWEKWRPIIELLRLEGLPVKKLFFFVLPYMEFHVDQLIADMKKIAPNTEIIPILHGEKSTFCVADLANHYLFFLNYFKQYMFTTENEAYYFHFGPGNTFAHAFMLSVIINTQRLPMYILHVRNKKQLYNGMAYFETYSADHSTWLSEITLQKNIDGEENSILESFIRSKNKNFNKTVKEIQVVAAKTSSPILLYGETGTGKTFLAERIYKFKIAQKLIDGKFISINCALLHGELILSTLFGHTKGAFTGALSNRSGSILCAHKGILFLDEISELHQKAQAMLLTALEEKRFTPLGSDSECYSDFQLICATNKNLMEEVEKGNFREDLFARINTWQFTLPTLKERPEDIETNIDFELYRIGSKQGVFIKFSPEAKEMYVEFICSSHYPWPGNFRTLGASIERMATLASKDIIMKEDVLKEIEKLKSLLSDKKQVNNKLLEMLDKEIYNNLDEFEKPSLELVLEICSKAKNKTEASKTLFQTSRKLKKNNDDTTRLSKYLAKYNLTWETIKNYS